MRKGAGFAPAETFLTAVTVGFQAWGSGVVGPNLLLGCSEFSMKQRDLANEQRISGGYFSGT